MANGVALRPGFVWTNGTPVTSTEFSTFDQAQVEAVRGTGGVWQPTATPIEITGGLGLWSRRLRGGPLLSGNPAFDISDTTGDVFVRGATTFSAAVLFNGAASFASTAGFSGAATFSAAVNLNATTTVGGAGTFVLPGASMVLNNSAFPVRTPNVSFSSRTLRWTVLGSSSSLVNPGTGAGTVQYTTAGAITLDVELVLNPNCEYTRIDVTIKGAPGHAGFPAVLPTCKIEEIDGNGAVTATIVALNTMNPGLLATYEAGFTSAYSVTAFTPNVDRRYVLRMVNENGANALAGLHLMGLKAFGTVKTFGRTGEL